MSLVAISGNASGTGTLTIAAPNTNSDFTLTLPQTTATLGINGSAFSAYAGSATSLTGSAFTKVLFDTKEFDTNSNFASSRFTPTVAGYYQINGHVSVNGGAQLVNAIFKNGSEYKRGTNIRVSSDGSSVASIVYFNGSTDYVEIYCFASTTINTNTGIALVYFNGSMVRAA